MPAEIWWSFYMKLDMTVKFSLPEQKMKFSIRDFFSECDQIRNFLQIWSHLLKKYLMEKFCALYLKCLFLQKRVYLLVTRLFLSQNTLVITLYQFTTGSKQSGWYINNLVVKNTDFSRISIAKFLVMNAYEEIYTK